METLKEKVVKILNPNSIHEALCLTRFYLKVSGMFPYRWVKDKYEVSPLSMIVTIVHITFYCVVNARLIHSSVEEYSAPVIYDTSVGVAGQFIVKIIGVNLTVVIFMKVLLGTKKFLKILRFIVSLLHQLEEMDMDVMPLYKRLFLFSLIQTVAIIALTTWTLTDGIFFYNKMNNDLPTLEYFFVVSMSHLYKYCALMNMFSYIYITYEITEFINGKFEEKLGTLFDKWSLREEREREEF